MNNPHDPAHELNVWGKAAEGTKNGCYAELRMIKSLTQHLYLDDAIKFAIFQFVDCFVLLIRVHLTVDFPSFHAKLLIYTANLPSVID